MRLFARAFPCNDQDGPNGMFLRDYFAIRILQSVHPENVAMNPDQRKQSAAYAYEMADAMLTARED
jgi:hypothetical protein